MTDTDKQRTVARLMSRRGAKPLSKDELHSAVYAAAYGADGERRTALSSLILEIERLRHESADLKARVASMTDNERRISIAPHPASRTPEQM